MGQYINFNITAHRQGVNNIARVLTSISGDLWVPQPSPEGNKDEGYLASVRGSMLQYEEDAQGNITLFTFGGKFSSYEAIAQNQWSDCMIAEKLASVLGDCDVVIAAEEGCKPHPKADANGVYAYRTPPTDQDSKFTGEDIADMFLDYYKEHPEGTPIPRAAFGILHEAERSYISSPYQRAAFSLFLSKCVESRLFTSEDEFTLKGMPADKVAQICTSAKKTGAWVNFADSVVRVFEAAGRGDVRSLLEQESLQQRKEEFQPMESKFERIKDRPDVTVFSVPASWLKHARNGSSDFFTLPVNIPFGNGVEEHTRAFFFIQDLSGDCGFKIEGDKLLCAIPAGTQITTPEWNWNLKCWLSDVLKTSARLTGLSILKEGGLPMEQQRYSERYGENRVPLNISYHEKDTAKRATNKMRWDADARQWYLDANGSVEEVAKSLASLEMALDRKLDTIYCGLLPQDFIEYYDKAFEDFMEDRDSDLDL